jgi:hypothetical protein
LERECGIRDQYTNNNLFQKLSNTRGGWVVVTEVLNAKHYKTILIAKEDNASIEFAVLAKVQASVAPKSLLINIEKTAVQLGI